jgi:hypothetical protein
LAALNSLSSEEMENLWLITEDKQRIKLKDLIKTQDQVVQELTAGASEFICILRGATGKAQQIGSNHKIPLTSGGKYGNSQKFDLFIPASFVEKNDRNIQNIENALIYCYGVPIKNYYGCKIDVYSITHQILVLRKFEQKLT